MSEQSGEYLKDRRVCLEERFFAKQNQELIKRFRERQARNDELAALRVVSGIDDEGTLGELIDLGVTRGSLAALGLVPLVMVAWADSKLDRLERRAILDAARESGVIKGSEGYELLESWLETEPSSALLEAWKDYAGEVQKGLSEEGRAAFKEGILGRARKVAGAAGGFLGIGSISFLESRKLKQLAATFD